MGLIIGKGEFPGQPAQSQQLGLLHGPLNLLEVISLVLGAAWLTVQLPLCPCCYTEPCCVLSCRFSGEPTRTVSALFLLLPPPPCPALAEAAWLVPTARFGWKREGGRCFSASPGSQSLASSRGIGSPNSQSMHHAGHSPFQAFLLPRGCQASAGSLAGLVLSPCPVQGFTSSRAG